MVTKKLELLCIGNALVDVFARGDEEAAVRFGITAPVQHIEIDKLKEFISELPACITVSGGAKRPHARHRACLDDECNTACPQENFSPLIITSGGGAANAAKIAGLLGTKVCFTGALGSDEFGQLFENDLAEAGVELRLFRKLSSTGICLIFKTEKNETRIAASPGAALEFSESDINPEDIKNAKLVLIDGYILNRSGLVRHILGLAKEYGRVAVLDLGSAAIAAGHAEEIVEYIQQYSLILFMNKAEAEAFYNSLKMGNTGESSHRETEGRNLQKMFDFFKTLTEVRPLAGGRTVIVVKLGPDGAISFAEGKTHRSETQAITPVETTGAGDAFCAGFLSAWVRGKSLPDCGDMGNRTARLVLDAEGARIDKKRLKDITL